MGKSLTTLGRVFGTYYTMEEVRGLDKDGIGIVSSTHRWWGIVKGCRQLLSVGVI